MRVERLESVRAQDRGPVPAGLGSLQCTMISTHMFEAFVRLIGRDTP